MNGTCIDEKALCKGTKKYGFIGHNKEENITKLNLDNKDNFETILIEDSYLYYDSDNIFYVFKYDQNSIITYNIKEITIYNIYIWILIKLITFIQNC